MKFYQEITLLPKPEIAEAFLMSKVFMQIHLAMVEARRLNSEALYGISFPNYHELGLGKKLRVFSTSKENVDNLKLPEWLERFSDYIHIMRARPVPESRVTGYAVYKRYQQRRSAEALARRYANRHNIPYEEALNRYKNMKKDYSYLPYVIMKSLSSAQKFSLFVEKMDSPNTAVDKFDNYGLSSKVALPVF